jgi:hypothetical protein
MTRLPFVSEHPVDVRTAEAFASGKIRFHGFEVLCGGIGCERCERCERCEEPEPEPSYVRKLWAALRGRLDLPASGGRRERVASPEEAAALIAALPADLHALYAMACLGGLRRGELRALRCSNVDYPAATTIRVERSWDDQAGEVSPKSRKASAWFRSRAPCGPPCCHGSWPIGQGALHALGLSPPRAQSLDGRQRREGAGRPAAAATARAPRGPARLRLADGCSGNPAAGDRRLRWPQLGPHSRPLSPPARWPARAGRRAPRFLPRWRILWRADRLGRRAKPKARGFLNRVRKFDSCRGTCCVLKVSSLN